MNTTIDSKKISKAGMKVTPQRVAVYEALNFLGHASTDEIIRKVHETSPFISPATIYNTLEKFVMERLISRVPTDGNKAYFDITEPPHIHLVAEDHTKVSDLEDVGLQQIVDEYLTCLPIPGFTLSRAHVVLIGRFE